MTHWQKSSYRVVMIGLIGLILFFNFVPVYQITANAFKSADDYNGAGKYEGQGINIILPPRDWTLDSFRYFFTEGAAVRALLNTILISVFSVFFLEVLGATTGLVLAQYRVPFTNKVVAFMIGAMAIPIVMTMITTFRITRSLHALDTYQGAITALVAQSLPFVIFLFYGYYRTLPKEILEAAEMDGASFLQVALRLVLPMSGPIMSTVGILIFMNVWATCLIGLIILRKEQMYILSMVIQNMEIVLRWRIPVYYAAFVVMSLPMLAVAWWAQRYITTGMLAGAVKE